MNSLLTQQLEKLTALEQKLGGQAGAYAQVTEAANTAADSMGGMTEGMAEMGEKAEESKGFFGGLVDSMKKFNENIKSTLSKYLTPLKDGLDLLGVNFESLTNIISNPLAAAFGFLRTAYDTIIDKAAKLAEEQQKLLEAFEKVRDKFGSFNENTSRRIKTGYEQFSGALRTAAGNSTAFASKFQMGIDGSVEQLQKIAEIAEDLGPIFDSMGQQFNDATAQLYVLKDGLNFSADALQQTARLAQLNGKSVKQFSQEIMGSVDKIGRNFGVSTKVLGADVGKALSNFKMLGKMTGDYVKQITQAAVFTRKLGFELTELTGLVDKFDDFEQGAEAAAQLAQGFGLVLDPLKMMNMQDPAARLQEVQRAFVATGRSVESMTRKERELLASSSGLSEEILTQALSAKGLSQSYDEIAAGADAASKKQKSTEQIMTDLADNIENVIQPLVDLSGFVTAFINGFLRGFGMSGGIMEILGIFAKGLKTVARIGGETGKIFADFFFPKSTPGAPSPLVTLATTISNMFINIATTIKDFVRMVGEGDVSGAVERLFTGIYSSISNAFGGATGAFSTDGLISKFGTKLLQVLEGALKFLAKKIPEWTASLKNMFKKEDDKGVAGGMKSAFDSALDSLTETFKSIDWISILGEFGGALLEAIPRFFEKYPIATTLAGIFLGGGPIATALGGISSQLFSQIGSIFSSDAAAAAAGGGGSAGANAAVAGISDGVETIGAAAVAPAVEKSQGIIERIFKILEEPAKITAMATAIAFAIGKIGNAIRDVLLSFMDPLPGRYESFVDVVVNSANKFEAVPWENLASLGAVLGGVFLGIGGIVAVIATQASKFSGMQALAFLVGGAIFAAGLSLLGSGEGQPGFFGKLLGGIGSLLQDIVTPFGDPLFTGALTTIGAMSGDIDKLASVSGSLAKLMTSLLEIGNALPKKYLGLGGTDFEALREPMTEVLALLNGDTENVGLLTQLTRISIPAGLDTIASKIAPAATIMTSVKSIVTSLTGFGDLKNAHTVLTKLNNSDVNLIDNLNTFTVKMNGLTTLNPTVSGNVSVIKSALTSIGTIVEELQKLSGVTSLAPIVKALNGEVATSTYQNGKLIGSTAAKPGLLEQIGKIVGGLNTHFATGVDGAVSVNISSLTAAITSVSTAKESLTKLGDIFQTTRQTENLLKLLPKMGKISTDMTTEFSKSTVLTAEQGQQYIAGFDATFGVLHAYAESIELLSTGLAQEKLDNFAARAAAVVQHTAKVKEILENLDAVPINAVVNGMGENMKIANKVMSVNGGAVKVSVNLNVTMNAEKMASALVVGGYLEPTDNFGEYMQNTDGVGEMFSSPDTKYATRTDTPGWRSTDKGRSLSKRTR